MKSSNFNKTTRGLEFNVELKAPTNPLNIPKYFDKISDLLHYTNKVSIASKQIGLVPGFDQNYNLAKYLLTRKPSLDILFHLTCNDLNKVNVHSRLTLLGLLDIKRVLVVTGDDYIPPETQSELFFKNSNELLECIIKLNWATRFKSIGVAGYPDGNGKESRNNQEECERLRHKLELGANAIYTQCIFDPKVFKDFAYHIRRKFSHLPVIDIVPSVAVFQRHSNLQMISKLTRVSLDERLATRFCGLDDNVCRAQAKEYLLSLCRALKDKSLLTVDLCTFGQFELTSEIIKELQLDSNDNDDGDHERQRSSLKFESSIYY